MQSSVGLGLIKGGLPITEIRGSFNVVANPINASKHIKILCNKYCDMSTQSAQGAVYLTL